MTSLKEESSSAKSLRYHSSYYISLSHSDLSNFIKHIPFSELLFCLDYVFYWSQGIQSIVISVVNQYTHFFYWHIVIHSFPYEILKDSIVHFIHRAHLYLESVMFLMLSLAWSQMAARLKNAFLQINTISFFVQLLVYRKIEQKNFLLSCPLCFSCC